MPKFLDQIGVGMTNAGKTVSQKVKNMSEVNKLNTQKKAEENNIQKNLIAIGQKYYQLCKEHPDEAFREMVAAIQDSEQKMETIQQEIERVNAREPELMPMPQCATESPKKPAAAPECVCPQCSKTVTPDSRFCDYCGACLTGTTDGCAGEVTPATEPEITQPVTEPEQTPDMPYGAEHAPVTEPDTAPQVAFCSHCGSKLKTPGQRFCGECGKEV